MSTVSRSNSHSRITTTRPRSTMDSRCSSRQSEPETFKRQRRSFGGTFDSRTKILSSKKESTFRETLRNLVRHNHKVLGETAADQLKMIRDHTNEETNAAGRRVMR